MERDMQEAVAAMRFEDAAKLRDGIKLLQKVCFFCFVSATVSSMSVVGVALYCSLTPQGMV